MERPKKSFTCSDDIQALGIKVNQEKMVACATLYNSWIWEFDITDPLTQRIGRMFLILKAHGFRKPAKRLTKIFKADHLELIEAVARDMEGWAEKIYQRTKEPRMRARKAQVKLPHAAAESNYWALLDPAVPKGSMYPTLAF